ncbi:MAG: PAS domain S-box protein [Proteobacteria bacterium]|nr:PAS domain S-box protein [Pseudomonadota bacterium]
MFATKNRLGARVAATGDQVIGDTVPRMEEHARDLLETARLETARVEMKRQNRAKNEALRDLIGASLQGVLIVTKRHEPLLANQTCAQIFGFASPAGITELDSIEKIIPSSTLTRLGTIGVEYRDGLETTKIHEFDGVRKDGSIVRLKSTAKSIDWQGRPAVMLMLLEISGPENAENAQPKREAHLGVIMDDDEERLRDFAEIASDWFWETDENLRFTYFSGRNDDIGLDIETALGKTHLEMTIEDTAHKKWQDYQADLTARKSFKDFRFMSRARDGRVMHMSVSGKPLFDKVGNFRGYRGTGADISAEANAEEAAVSVQKRFMADDRKVLDTGEIVRSEHRLASGNRTHMVVKFPVRDAASDIEAIGTIETDITALKETQETARKSESHLRAIVDNIADGIITIDTGGIIESASGSVENMFGYEAEKLIGRNVSILIPETNPRQLDGYIHRYIETGESKILNIQPREVTGRRKDGSTFPMEFTIGEMRIDGRPLIVVAVRDISKRLEVESALRRLSARLISAQEDERSRIARELHDDFNQRLALLAVDLERIHDGLPDSQEDLADGLASLLQRTKELASDVHRLSHQLHPSILQHLGLVTAAKTFCKEISEQHDIHIELAHHVVPRMLPSDVALCLYRIIQEAIRNVIKHSGANSARVEITKTASELKLQISDNGIGFDIESDQSRRGLGLLSMRERLRQVDGTISFMRIEPTGTRINVRVPFRDVEPH